MNIKVLGSGCASCNKLEKNTEIALKNLGLNVSIEKVTDFEKISGYGVMGTPALVVDEKVLSAGKVLSPKDIEKLLKK